MLKLNAKLRGHLVCKCYTGMKPLECKYIVLRLLHVQCNLSKSDIVLGPNFLAG